MTKTFTDNQKKAIELRDKNLLVTASAGTGKTTVMIERITRLIEDHTATVDNIMVVTFTTAAAAEMKARLRKSLSERAEDKYVFAQLERIDECSISTLHSFCADLLRNYFYIADVDPNFGIVDRLTAQNLLTKTLSDTLKEYYLANDKQFDEVFRMFGKKRKDESLKEIILKLYEFGKCQPDFNEWYAKTRCNYDGRDNLFAQILNGQLTEQMDYYNKLFDDYANTARNIGAIALADFCQELSSSYALPKGYNFEKNYAFIRGLPRSRTFSPKLKEYDNSFKICEEEFNLLIAELDSDKKASSDFLTDTKKMFGEEDYDEVLANMQSTLAPLDKLVEIVGKFDEKYAAAKKERAMVDFADLEHFALKILSDDNARSQLTDKYKMIFVDEYQDINAVQEELICKLKGERNLFCVGDVKQSIYGFRECEPSIFVEKQKEFCADSNSEVIELNDNFRSDKCILDFINSRFNDNMTESFGSVDYKNRAQLSGGIAARSSATPTVALDVVRELDNTKFVNGKYDISAVEESTNNYDVVEGRLICNYIKKIVGSVVETQGVKCRIAYSDVAILLRGMKDSAKTIYDCLIAENIPVNADFNDEDSSKEILDLVNFLRVLDNPTNDIYFVGVALSHFGKFDEEEVARIKISTDNGERDRHVIDIFMQYVGSFKDEIAAKIDTMLQLIDRYRIFAQCMTVDALLQRLVMDTNYALYVLGLNNGQIRHAKLSQYLRELMDKQYGKSVDKYLQYLDAKTSVAVGVNNGSGAVTMMTIHKSKGLEFPIVIGANLNKKFNSDKDTLIADRKIGLAVKYYDFAKMQISNSLSFCATKYFRTLKQKEEELSLLYVLLTRAKYKLYLVASGDKVGKKKLFNPSKASCMADWLLNNLDDKLASVRYINGNTVEVDMSVASTSLLCEQSDDLTEINKNISFVYPYARDITLPTKVVSSQLKEYADDSQEIDERQRVVRLFDPKDSAAQVGTAYHKVYENVKTDYSVEQIKNTLNNLTKCGKIDYDAAELVDPQLIYNGLNNIRLLPLLQGEVYHEVPFMLSTAFDQVAEGSTIDSPVILQGIIDMLVIHDEGATVIDFKYTNRSDLIVKNYSPQIKSYMLAAKQILKVDKVDGYVLSIKDNKLVKF